MLPAPPTGVPSIRTTTRSIRTRPLPARHLNTSPALWRRPPGVFGQELLFFEPRMSGWQLSQTTLSWMCKSFGRSATYWVLPLGRSDTNMCVPSTRTSATSPGRQASFSKKSSRMYSAWTPRTRRLALMSVAAPLGGQIASSTLTMWLFSTVTRPGDGWLQWTPSWSYRPAPPCFTSSQPRSLDCRPTTSPPLMHVPPGALLTAMPSPSGGLTVSVTARRSTTTGLLGERLYGALVPAGTITAVAPGTPRHEGAVAALADAASAATMARGSRPNAFRPPARRTAVGRGVAMRFVSVMDQTSSPNANQAGRPLSAFGCGQAAGDDRRDNRSRMGPPASPSAAHASTGPYHRRTVSVVCLTTVRPRQWPRAAESGVKRNIAGHSPKGAGRATCRS